MDMAIPLLGYPEGEGYNITPPTFTAKGSLSKSSIVLPSRLRFLEPQAAPSLDVCDVSATGVKIGRVEDASESGFPS